MTTLQLIGLSAATLYGISALIVVGVFIYDALYYRAWGDGFNAAQDRFTRSTVPLSEEVLAEMERRGR